MPGQFTPTQLQRINLKVESFWTDSRVMAEYETFADTAKAILENQTATFTALKDPGKDNKVGVTWIDTCAIEVEDCSSDCDFTGDEVDTQAQEYDYNLCKEVKFSVDEEKLRTNQYDYQEVVGRAMAKSLKGLDEWMNQQAILRLKQYADINVAPQPWTYDAADKTTLVPAAQYNTQLVTTMLRQSYMNKMGVPYFVDNGSLWDAWQNAKFDSANSEGKGNAARIAALKMYFDLIGFGQAGITDDTFMIAPGAVAMQSKVRYSTTPTEYAGSVQQTRYSIASPSLPGISYDVFYTLRCVDIAGVSHIIHDFKIKATAGIWLNPKGCPVTVGNTTYTPSGVLSYTQLIQTT
jgi:hypothetical protein